MKKLMFLIGISLLIAFVGCKSKELTPEQIEKSRAFRENIEQKGFTFTANQIIPTRGSSRHLTSNYSVKMSNDSLSVDLPFFGRAYRAPMNPTEGGYKLISTNFEYKMEEKKAGSYEIMIKPNDVANSDNSGLILRLSLHDSGYGSLSVSSTYRETVNFYGNVK